MDPIPYRRNAGAPNGDPVKPGNFGKPYRCRKHGATEFYLSLGKRQSRSCKVCRRGYDQRRMARQRLASMLVRFANTPTSKIRLTASDRRMVAQHSRRAELVRLRKRKLVGLFGGRCQDCGIIGPPVIYQFDHRDPATKKFDIASKGRCSWRVLIPELEKCDLVCANCHAIRTARDKRIRRKQRLTLLAKAQAAAVL